MAVVEKVIAAPPERVFDVLADGWTYSDWVVGTAHIRDVDESWPQPGSNLHHRAGPWPLSVQDRTTVLVCEAPHRLVMHAGLSPLGTASVSFTLTPVGDGGTHVRFVESFGSGPLRWLHTRINDMLLQARNREALRRLGDIAIRRQNQHRNHP